MAAPQFTGVYDPTPFAQHAHKSIVGLSKRASKWAAVISPMERLPELDELEKDRAQLVQDERATKVWDAQARSVLDGIEAVTDANELLDGAKKATRKLEYKSQPGEVLPNPGDHEMGHIGSESWLTTENTQVAKLLQPMHKGAELHVHTNTLADPIRYMKKALAKLPKTNHIRFTKPLTTAANWKNVEVGFENWEEGTAEGNPFDSKYVSPRIGCEYPLEDGKIATVKKFSNGMLFTNFVACFHEEYSQVASELPGSDKYIGEDGKYSPFLWCLDRIVITEDDRVAADCECNPLWAKFNMGTRAWKNLVNVECLFEDYCMEMFQALIDQGRGHCEHRFIATEAGIMTDDGTGLISVSGQIQTMIDCWDRFDSSRTNAERKLLPYMPKIVFCAPRGIPVVPLESQTDEDYELNIQAKCRQCIRLCDEFGDAIAAFDLVGAEDRGQPTRNFLKQLIWFRNTCVDKGYYVPFLFHCGESNIDLLGTLDQENSGCYDFILLNVLRAGHGLALITKYPFLIEILRQRNANGARHAIEINLTSNILLGAYANANHHPLEQVAYAGIPWVLCVDNANLFHTSGHLEFVRAFLGWARLELVGLFQSVLWSYQYSLLNEEQIQERCEWATEEFISYCKNIASPDNVLDVFEHYINIFPGSDKNREPARKFIRDAFPTLSKKYDGFF